MTVQIITCKSDIACERGSFGPKYAEAHILPLKRIRPATSSELLALHEISNISISKNIDKPRGLTNNKHMTTSNSLYL